MTELTEPDPADGRRFPVFVVAAEYVGKLLPHHGEEVRRVVRQHAFDAVSGSLCHRDQHTRVGFSDPLLGWPQSSPGIRCAECDAAVSRAVAGIIAAVLHTSTRPTTRRADDVLPPTPPYAPFPPG